MRPTLLVTNDFPPRAGGIQTYLEGFTSRLDSDNLIVYASSPPDGGAEEYDAARDFEVVRYPGTMMLPTPEVTATMQDLIRTHDIANVWFGASTPLGIMANASRAAGADQTIATTHGHEIGWSMIPGARQFLGKIFADNDVVTYLTQATLRRLSPLLRNTRTMRMPGGINPEAFARDPEARRTLRARYGYGEDTAVVVCISRLVPRKGQDLLIEAWPEVKARFGHAELLIVGKGPYGDKLREMAEASPASDSITFTGEVPYAELAAHYSAGDVYAMPCRTRGGGLDIEGLGIVYLEAYAAGLVVDGRSREALISGLTYLLEDPDRAAAMGQAGKDWVDREWRWEHLVQPLREIL